MSEPTMPLSPDEEQPVTLGLGTVPHTAEQPYGATAVMTGMLALLVIRWAWRGVALPHALGLTLIVTVGMYLGLTMAAPRLHLPLLSLFAAELAMIYSLPAYMVFSAFGRVPELLLLIAALLIVGALGLLVGYGLEEWRSPGQVITVTFLAVFVTVNLWFLLG